MLLPKASLREARRGNTVHPEQILRILKDASKGVLKIDSRALLSMNIFSRLRNIGD